MPKLIAMIVRLSHGFAIATVVVIPLTAFFFSLLSLHSPEVIAVLLLRTVDGYLQLFVLFATSTLPIICVVEARRTMGRQWCGWVKFAIASTVTAFYLLMLTLLCYRMETGIAFDLSIVWYHFDDAVRTALVLGGQYTWTVVVLFALVVCHFHGVLIILSSKWMPDVLHFPGQKTSRAASYALSACCFTALLASQAWSENGLRYLFEEARSGSSQARSLYRAYFDESLRRSKTQPALFDDDLSTPNLFIVQLESINAELVTPAVTPNLLALLKNRGVVFPRIQSASVFTILSMESILCGTLPTLDKNLAQMNSVHGRLNCLPRVFKSNGFKTLYFQAYPDLQFNNMKRFLSSIGFDEVHAEDIMKPGDPRLKWGYVEDVFYRRVFEYLENYRKDRVFVYILGGSANHYPFFDDDIATMFAAFKARLPYASPRSLRERISNTMFIQDYFFGEMYRQLYAPRFRATSQMFVLGDHSWPIGLHNSHNLRGAFQENFATAMAFIPQQKPQRSNAGSGGRIVPRLYSYLSLFSTILEMYGVKLSRSYGESFVAELKNESVNYGNPSDRCVLSVQPFSGGHIAVINYPKKYVFDLKKNFMTSYNLAADHDELNARESVPIDKGQLALLDSCLRNLSGRDSALQIEKRYR